jgi:hypothetical protein
MKSLVSRRRHSYGVVTRFSLRKAISTGGIAYSQVQFNFVRDLTEQESEEIKPIIRQALHFAQSTLNLFDNTNSAEYPSSTTGTTTYSETEYETI